MVRVALPIAMAVPLPIEPLCALAVLTSVKANNAITAQANNAKPGVIFNLIPFSSFLKGN